MPRYFFEIDSDEIGFEDGEGVDYASEKDALRTAERLSETIGRDIPELVGMALVVLDNEEEPVGRFVIMPPQSSLH